MNWLFILALPVIAIITHFIGRKQYATHDKGIVFITGSSTGIGRHAAEHIAHLNPNYLILAGVRKSSDAESIENLNVKNLRPIIVDVANHESCVHAVDEIKALVQTENMPFIAMVNNAGVSRTVPVEFHELADARNIFDTNFFGALDLIQLTLPLLRESKGRVVMVSSVLGFFSVPQSSIYSASKFAMEGFSDSLRREVDHFGISVSVIEPAFVKSAIHETTKKATSHVIEETGVYDKMQQLYPHYINDKARHDHQREIDGASDPIVTSIAIEHALFSQYPKTRYVIATAIGMPAQVLSWLNWILTDRLKDLLIGAHFRNN